LTWNKAYSVAKPMSISNDLQKLYTKKIFQKVPETSTGSWRWLNFPTLCMVLTFPYITMKKTRPYGGSSSRSACTAEKTRRVLAEA